MKKNVRKRFIGGVAAVVMCLTGVLGSCGTGSDSSSSSAGSSSAAQTSESKAETAQGEETFTENVVGESGGYGYELWKDNGDTTMVIKDGGNFSCEWSNINNCLFRRGQKFDCTQTYQELGNISVNYGVDYQPDGNSYMCVYGWTRDPLIEYYIVETWGSWRPPGGGAPLGVVNIDGGTYEIYKTTRYEQPSIDGTQTFDQYWSVRKDKPETDGTKVEGTISISKHFDAWEQCGLHLGKMYEVALNIEGYQSQGKADIYKNELTIDGSYSAEPAVDVTSFVTLGFFNSEFEDGEDGWQPRGSAAIASTGDEAKSGSKSLYVSGRTDNWNGAAIDLDPSTYTAGMAYSFKAAVMQKSGEAATMKMTLQYNSGGAPNYAEVASASAPSGEWITLENSSYAIPDDATDMILYIESPDSLTDFYIDDASSAESGTQPSGGDAKKDEKKEEPAEEYEFADPVAVTSDVDISWIDPDKPMVAISFDDGASANAPGDPAYRIIDAVADAGFHATFFYVGNWIKTEEQVQYAYEKGMEIANHTTSHPYLSKLEPQAIRDEFEKTHEKLKNIIGAEPSRVMRLPYLDSSSTVTKTLNDVALISCSVDTKDWNKATTDDIVNTIKTAKENGTLENAIVLCHENYATTAEAMEILMPYLKEEGWQVVTVSEMFAVQGKELMGGKVYTKLS
ncbi:MAG: glycoside hydrolase family 11 protein [Ruminococcus sp.]|nr:glycoside hydrolase family 11 protein [Ruminococcus sp.]